jgi:hypothetical protein
MQIMQEFKIIPLWLVPGKPGTKHYFESYSEAFDFSRSKKAAKPKPDPFGDPPKYFEPVRYFGFFDEYSVFHILHSETVTSATVHLIGD